VVAVVLLASTWAHAASDIENFESKVGKVATTVSDVFTKPKNLCACLNDASPTRSAADRARRAANLA
jgi:hypothetical protein